MINRKTINSLIGIHKKPPSQALVIAINAFFVAGVLSFSGGYAGTGLYLLSAAAIMFVLYSKDKEVALYALLFLMAVSGFIFLCY